MQRKAVVLALGLALLFAALPGIATLVMAAPGADDDSATRVPVYESKDAKPHRLAFGIADVAGCPLDSTDPSAF